MKTPEKYLKVLSEAAWGNEDIPRAQRLSAALSAAGYGILPKAPEGYVTVPREPTEEMIQAYKTAARNAVGRWCLKAYRAMIAAAPTKESRHPEG